MLLSVAYGRRHGVLERITDPAEEPISLSEAKLFLRVDDTAEDAVITRLISAAREAAEDYIRRSLITQNWVLWFDDYVSAAVRLPMGPVQSVTHVKTYSRVGSASTMDSAGYYLNAGKESLFFDAAPISTKIEIAYQAGYGDSAAVPEAIRQGLHHHIASMFEDRVEGIGLTAQAKALYAPFKVEML